MKLYLLTQDEVTGYDIFDSMVVCAKNEDDARVIHPDVYSKDPWSTQRYCRSWCGSPAKVIVKLIGTAKPGTKAGIVCSSFNGRIGS
jgi:hypothetical protein